MITLGQMLMYGREANGKTIDRMPRYSQKEDSRRTVLLALSTLVISMLSS